MTENGVDIKFLKIPAALLFLIIMISGTPAGAYGSESFSFGGYFQVNPVWMQADMVEPFGEQEWTEYRAQNRLNFRWDAAPGLVFHWQMRTRVFGGDTVEDIPGYADEIDTDSGLMNLSYMLYEQDRWLLHYNTDRLYAEWEKRDWNIRVGRQRINWGVNMLTNPNDIFNIYSIYDFDYPERPGSDALRVQRFFGFSSRAELAVSSNGETEETIAAALYAFDLRGYDIQLISGYYRERFTAGAGWAGNIGGAGFKGETVYYSDIEEKEGQRDTNYIFSASLDYMFPNTLFAVFELLYNHEGGTEEPPQAGGALSPDNPSFSKYQAALHSSYQLHPLVDIILTLVYYPDEEAVFVSPSLVWSVVEDLDFRILGQFFRTGKDSAMVTSVNIVTASLKYNF